MVAKMYVYAESAGNIIICVGRLQCYGSPKNYRLQYAPLKMCGLLVLSALMQFVEIGDN